MNTTENKRDAGNPKNPGEMKSEKEEMGRAIELLNGAIEALSWWETQDYEAALREDMAIRYISKALKILEEYKGEMKYE